VNILLIGIGCCLLTVSAKTESAKDRLTRDLLKEHQPAVDPGNIELEFGVMVICSKFDKFTAALTSTVWEYHSWKDSRLSWNPADYAGVNTLRVPAKLVWTPDTKLYNSLTSFTERDTETNAVLKSDGTVLWIPRATYRIQCQANDDQANCKLRVGSWTYDGNNVVLKQHGQDAFDLSNYDEACPSVIGTHSAAVVSHTYPCCEEPYPSLDVTFTVKPRGA